MNDFSTVHQLLIDIYAAQMVFWMSHWRAADQLDLNVGDWEEIRLFYPGAGVASKTLFGIPVRTWSALGHAQFRLRLDGEIVFTQL